MTQERASLRPQVLRLSEHSLPWGIGARGAACALLAILLVFGIAARDRIAPGQYRVAGLDDTALHLAIIERMAAGETVYSSIGTELRARGYPSGSTANWRTPLHYWTVAQVGTARTGRALVILAHLTVLLGAYALRHRFRGSWLVAGALLMGTMVPIIAFRPAGIVMAEYWAGMLLALALAFYHFRWWTAAACCGVVAIFVRELAVPFGVVCGLFALSERRHREGAVWVVGGLAYVAYLPAPRTGRLGSDAPDGLVLAALVGAVSGLALRAANRVGCGLDTFPAIHGHANYGGARAGRRFCAVDAATTPVAARCVRPALLRCRPAVQFLLGFCHGTVVDICAVVQP